MYIWNKVRDYSEIMTGLVRGVGSKPRKEGMGEVPIFVQNLPHVYYMCDTHVLCVVCRCITHLIHTPVIHV